jgi:hypothetical protein
MMARVSSIYAAFRAAANICPNSFSASFSAALI